MVLVFVEDKGAYCCLTARRAGQSKSCAIHLQQPHYHNACRPYWLCQHAEPQQNAQEHWQLMRAQPKLEKPLHAPTRGAVDNTACVG